MTHPVAATLTALTLPAMLLSAGGCDSGRPVGGGGQGGEDTTVVVRRDAGPRVPPKGPPPPAYLSGEAVDVLFVIDNSGSMGEPQQNLVQNFARLIDALRHRDFGADGSGRRCDWASSAGCQLPELHVGVINSDLGAGNYGLPSCEQRGGDQGRLISKPLVPGCTAPVDRYINYAHGKTNVPNAGTPEVDGGAEAAVVKAFHCFARLGSDGCGFEQHFEAMRLALQPDRNPGFLRDDALLAVIFVTDEDDCSAARDELFDPAQQSLQSPLGPLTSFRCFEHGFRCDVNDRFSIGPRRDCRPAGEWLHSIERYRSFLRSLRRPGQLVVAAIAGPADKVAVVRDGDRPQLAATCSSAAGNALPAIRMQALLDALAPDSFSYSECEANYGPALATIGRMISTRLAAARAR